MACGDDTFYITCRQKPVTAYSSRVLKKDSQHDAEEGGEAKIDDSHQSRVTEQTLILN